MTQQVRDGVAATVGFLGLCALTGGLIMCGHSDHWGLLPFSAGFGMGSFSLCYAMARNGR